MTISELVKQKSPANPDGRADKSEEAGKCREVLVLLGDEERHVSGDRQLRHLQRHGNDHAQNCGSDHDRGSASARWRGRQLAFEPFKRTKQDYRWFHWTCTDRAHLAGGPSIIATADAPMRNRLGSGFSTSIRTGRRCATRTQFSSRFT